MIFTVIMKLIVKECDTKLANFSDYSRFLIMHFKLLAPNPCPWIEILSKDHPPDHLGCEMQWSMRPFQRGKFPSFPVFSVRYYRIGQFNLVPKNMNFHKLIPSFQNHLDWWLPPPTFQAMSGWEDQMGGGLPGRFLSDYGQFCKVFQPWFWILMYDFENLGRMSCDAFADSSFLHVLAKTLVVSLDPINLLVFPFLLGM